MTEKAEWHYIGHVVVGVGTDCDCPPVPGACIDLECNDVYHPMQPHEGHLLIKPVEEDGLPEGWTMEKWQAACQLVAAAPELLAACEAALDNDYAAGFENAANMSEALREQLRAAIAKAKGGAQ